MTDIVERLRICAKFDPDQAEAADEIERLREALRPFAKLNLWPDDLGFEVSEDIKADEDWCDDANDARADDQWIKRGDIRAARAALKEDK
jgi:hypothetical protein